MSWHTCMRRSFWSPFSSLGIILTQTFRIPQSSVITFQALSLLLSIWRAIIRTVTWRLPHTTCLICSTLTPLLLVEILPLLSPLSDSHWNCCVTQKHVCYLTILSEVFQVLGTKFFPSCSKNLGAFTHPPIFDDKLPSTVLSHIQLVIL